MSELSFKQKLGAGQRLVGLFSLSTSSQVAEILGQSGFDFVVFDLEHTPNSLPLLSSQFLALKCTGTFGVVRVPGLDPDAIKPVLDMGFQAVMVPGIHTAAEAALAVRSVRYPPAGVRGIGGAVRATAYGRNTSYYAHANGAITTILLVETVEGIRNLNAMCAVDGVDAVFFGPSDLAADMGKLGQPGAEEVVAAVEDALRLVRRSGKAAGVSAPEHLASRYAKAGANMIALGSDLALFAQMSDALAARWVQPLKASTPPSS